MQQKRHTRKVKKQASAAAYCLLLLQHVDNGASSANPEEDMSVGTQTNLDSTLMEGINNKLKDLRAENIELKQQAPVSELTLNNLDGKDDKVKYLTDLSVIFCCPVHPVQLYSAIFTQKKSMTPFQMLLMTLVRLRLNMPEQFLAYEFSVSQTTVSRIFSNVIDVLYIRTKLFVIWPE